MDVVELAVEQDFRLHKVAGSWWPLPYLRYNLGGTAQWPQAITCCSSIVACVQHLNPWSWQNLEHESFMVHSQFKGLHVPDYPATLTYMVDILHKNRLATSLVAHGNASESVTAPSLRLAPYAFLHACSAPWHTRFSDAHSARLRALSARSCHDFFPVPLSNEGHHLWRSR